MLSYTVVIVDLAKADPVGLMDALDCYPRAPITTPPAIVVNSPVQNETIDSPHMWLNFTVIKPDAWFPSDVSDAFNYGEIFGNVTSVYYVVDGGGRQNIPVHDLNTLFSNAEFQPRTLSFSTTLNLTAGTHSVYVGVEADSYYWPYGLNLPPSPGIGFSNLIPSISVVSGGVEPVNFTVALPEPVIVSPESLTYNESSVPLAFTLGTSPISWVGYSLDGNDNVTVAGNTTLTDLSNGEHNITVYANDTFGNAAASQTVNFTVAVPPPVIQSFPAATVATVSGASAVIVVGAGLLVYFKKRKPATHRIIEGEIA